MILCLRGRCSRKDRPRISPRRWPGFTGRGCRRPRTFSIPASSITARVLPDHVTIAAGTRTAERRVARIVPPRPDRNRENHPSVTSWKQGSVWFRASIGRKKNAEARWLLPMICRRGGIEKQDVGAIRILDTTTEFEISGRVAESFAVKIQRPDKEDNIRIEPLADAPQSRHPFRSSRRTHLGREGGGGGPDPHQNDKFQGERGPKPHGKPRHDSEPGFGKELAFKKKKRSRDNVAPDHPARPAFGNKKKKNRRG